MPLVPSRANLEHLVGVGELPFLRYMETRLVEDTRRDRGMFRMRATGEVSSVIFWVCGAAMVDSAGIEGAKKTYGESGQACAQEEVR